MIKSYTSRFKSKFKWIDRLDVPVENYGSEANPIEAVSFDGVDRSLEALCGSDRILAECMKLSFSKAYGIQTGVMHPQTGDFGMFVWDVNSALAKIFCSQNSILDGGWD